MRRALRTQNNNGALILLRLPDRLPGLLTAAIARRLSLSFHGTMVNWIRCRGWITKCESFKGMRTIDGECVWMASLHLDGVAAEGFYALDRDNTNITWGCFVDFLNLGFGPPLRSNPLAELKESWPTVMVDEYQWQFQLMLCRCDDLSSCQQINFFGEGLATLKDGCGPLGTSKSSDDHELGTFL